MTDNTKISLAWIGIFLMLCISLSASYSIIQQVEKTQKDSKDRFCIVYGDGMDCGTDFTSEGLNEECEFLKEINPNGNPISSWQCKDFRVEKVEYLIS